MKKDKNNKKQRINYKNIIITFSIIMLSIVTILEVLLEKNILHTMIYVDNEYIYSMFTAIITLSTLCFTIVSIIVNVESNKVNGIKLKEIIKFKSSPFEIASMIELYLFLDLISVMALTYKWAMFITIVFSIDVLASAYYSGALLYVVSDDEKLKKIIKEEVLSNPQIFKEVYINEWIIELKKSLVNKNKTLKYEYVDLL